MFDFTETDYSSADESEKAESKLEPTPECCIQSIEDKCAFHQELELIINSIEVIIAKIKHLEALIKYIDEESDDELQE